MPIPHKPEGRPALSPYLIVKDAAAFLDFLERGVGGRLLTRMDYPGGAVAHAEVALEDSVVMVSEATEEFKANPTMLNLYVPDCDARHRQAVAAGAASVREPADQFYGDRSGGVRDAWGNLWFFATAVEALTEAEIQARMAGVAGVAGNAPA